MRKNYVIVTFKRRSYSIF